MWWCTGNTGSLPSLGFPLPAGIGDHVLKALLACAILGLARDAQGTLTAGVNDAMGEMAAGSQGSRDILNDSE